MRNNLELVLSVDSLVKMIKNKKKVNCVFIIKKIEKRILSYFLNFNAIFTARPHERSVKPTGNTPLVSICGICSKEAFPEEYIAATIGKASKPITPNLLLFSEICFCTFVVLMFYQSLRHYRNI